VILSLKKYPTKRLVVVVMISRSEMASEEASIVGSSMTVFLDV
jgi:hypothetical protein